MTKGCGFGTSSLFLGFVASKDIARDIIERIESHMLREHIDDARNLDAARNLARLIERLSLEPNTKLTLNPKTDAAIGLFYLLQWVFSERGNKALDVEPSIIHTLSTVFVVQD